MSNENLNLPRGKFESVVSQPLELDALGTELNICFQDIDGPREIKTCYGDICKTVNALRDYSRMLRMACEEWDLQGYHRAVYELHADKLEEISKKYQAGIGYDYDKAMEKCRKKREKGQRTDDVGGEAMAMAYLKAQRTAAAKKGGSSPSGIPALEAGQVEHYDILQDNAIIFWVSVSGVPQEVQAEARQISAGCFDPNCFVVCVSYDFQRRQFSVMTDSELSAAHPGGVCYLDGSGDKHWFPVEMSQAFLEQLFGACVKAAAHENLEIRAMELEACESAAQEMAGCFGSATRKGVT